MEPRTGPHTYVDGEGASTVLEVRFETDLRPRGVGHPGEHSTKPARTLESSPKGRTFYGCVLSCRDTDYVDSFQTLCCLVHSVGPKRWSRSQIHLTPSRGGSVNKCRLDTSAHSGVRDGTTKKGGFGPRPRTVVTAEPWWKNRERFGVEGVNTSPVSPG